MVGADKPVRDVYALPPERAIVGEIVDFGTADTPVGTSTSSAGLSEPGDPYVIVKVDGASGRYWSNSAKLAGWLAKENVKDVYLTRHPRARCDPY